MRRLTLSLGSQGTDIYVYRGIKELKAFRRFVKKHDLTHPFLEPTSASGLAFMYAIWTEDTKPRSHVLVHELIHSLTYIRNTYGMEDSDLQEWLAYSMSWCLSRLWREK